MARIRHPIAAIPDSATLSICIGVDLELVVKNVFSVFDMILSRKLQESKKSSHLTMIHMS